MILQWASPISSVKNSCRQWPIQVDDLPLKMCDSPQQTDKFPECIISTVCLFSQSLGSVGSSNCRGFHHMDFSENRLPGYPILRHLLVSNRVPIEMAILCSFWHAPLKKLPNIILLASYPLILGVKFPLLNKACYWSLYVLYILKKITNRFHHFLTIMRQYISKSK